MIAVYWVWRRELAVMLRAPILYVIGGLFLVVQGVAFAGLVGALSDPRRPAPLGTLLEGQLAGTLLTWVLELVVLTLLGMRAIADDKRSGGWESLLTAGVGEGAAVVGKWLAATTMYGLVWLPTLAYLGLVAAFRSDAGGWDGPAILTGYAGAIAVGAALLAWSVAASAAMSSSLAAGALGFAWLIALFLVGELPSLWPDLATSQPSAAAIFEAISLRAIATDFARGALAARSLVVLLGATLVGLSLAITLACAGRRRRRELRLRAAATSCLAIAAVALGVLAARHPLALDVSASGRGSLDDATRATLADLPGPATITIVQPTIGALEPVYDEVARVAAQMAAAGPVTVLRADPATLPGGLPAVARAAGLTPRDLASGGGIVIELAGRRRVVDVFAFAQIAAASDGAPIVERLAIEQAIAGALAALASARTVTVCALHGHGELAIDPDRSGRDWSAVAQRLRGEGLVVESLGAEALRGDPRDALARCQVVLVAGPLEPLTPEEALALQRFVRAGGAMVVAGGGTRATGAFPATGLEGVLAADGLGLPQAYAAEPPPATTQPPFFVVDGYTDHPINTGFARIRPTRWLEPRAVLATRGARPLILASIESWGERDLAAAPSKDLDDLAGPVALSALGASTKIVVVGSAESLTTAALAGGASAADLWLARAVRFVAGAPEPTIAITSRPPAQVRLIMTPGQRRAVIALSVAGIPLTWLVLGGAVVLWRRRRAR